MEEVNGKIQAFISSNNEWVVEGCYGDLIELVKPFANEAIFMNLSTELCQENAKNRPWESHKYESKEAQDNNLPMLLDWIAGYMERDDALSYSAHRLIFQHFQGKKIEITHNRA